MDCVAPADPLLPQLVPVLHAMRVFRMPLILINVLTIAYLVVLY